jgi:hypothetical protein
MLDKKLKLQRWHGVPFPRALFRGEGILNGDLKSKSECIQSLNGAFKGKRWMSSMGSAAVIENSKANFRKGSIAGIPLETSVMANDCKGGLSAGRLASRDARNRAFGSRLGRAAPYQGVLFFSNRRSVRYIKKSRPKSLISKTLSCCTIKALAFRKVSQLSKP